MTERPRKFTVVQPPEHADELAPTIEMWDRERYYWTIENGGALMIRMRYSPYAKMAAYAPGGWIRVEDPWADEEG